MAAMGRVKGIWSALFFKQKNPRLREGFLSNEAIRTKLFAGHISTVLAIEWPHLFSQPIYIPFIDQDDAFCLCRHSATQIGHRQTGGFAPNAPEIVNSK